MEAKASNEVILNLSQEVGVSDVTLINLIQTVGLLGYLKGCSDQNCKINK